MVPNTFLSLNWPICNMELLLNCKHRSSLSKYIQGIHTCKNYMAHSRSLKFVIYRPVHIECRLIMINITCNLPLKLSIAHILCSVVKNTRSGIFGKFELFQSMNSQYNSIENMTDKCYLMIKTRFHPDSQCK